MNVTNSGYRRFSEELDTSPWGDLSVGELLETIRHARGATLREVGKWCGCSHVYIWCVENNEISVSADLCRAVARELCVPVVLLLDRAGHIPREVHDELALDALRLRLRLCGS